jgi:hypothetical protein
MPTSVIASKWWVSQPVWKVTYPVYVNVIYKYVIWLLVFKSGKVQVYLWMLWYGKMLSWQLDFWVWQIMHLLSIILYWNLLTEFWCGTWGTDQTPALSRYRNWLLSHHLYLQLGYVMENIVPSTIYNILSLTKSTVLTANLILVFIKKNPVPNWWFS